MGTTLYVRTYKNQLLGTIVNAGAAKLVGSNKGVQSIADSILATVNGDVPEAYKRLNGYTNSALWISDSKKASTRAASHGHHIPGTPAHYKHGWVPLVPGFEPMPRGAPKFRQRDLTQAERNAAHGLISQSGNHRINDPLRHGQMQRRPDGSTFFNDPQGVSDEWSHSGLLESYDSLTHSGRVTKEGTVYRGVALPQGTTAEDAFQPGTTFRDLGYPSTTENIDFARQCAAARASGVHTGFEQDEHFQPTGGDQVIMKIALRKGQHAGPGSAVAKETILPRGAAFTVTGVGKPQQVTVDPDQPPYTQTVITVEIEGYD